MKGKKQQSYVKRGFTMFLSLAVCLSGISWGPAEGTTAKAAGSQIEIASASDLALIGKDAAHPMNGDYILTKDIDLSGTPWTPIGGAGGPEYCLVTGDRVFNGTFDGQGHVIDGLTIQADGSHSGYSKNQSGLFAMIGSDDANDYAEVKNIVFSNVSISHTLGGGDSIGTLAADVNGYAKVDNIAVISGNVSASVSSGGCDLVGMGGIAGQTRNNSQAVQLTNLYNAATVTLNGNPGTLSRCGGILGRIHQAATIGALSSCLNVGTVTSNGQQGYAINGIDVLNNASPSSTKNIENCYFLDTTGKGTTAVTSLSESDLASESVKDTLGSEYWMISKTGQIMPVVTEGKIVIPIPSPIFAEGDRASSVTQNFTLPLSFEGENGTETITWTSGNTDVIIISGSTAEVQPVLVDTSVTLTAVTSGGRTKEVPIVVMSHLSLKMSQEYAEPGTEVQAMVEGAPEDASFTYEWEIDGTTVSNSAVYTPKTGDLNKFITVRARLSGAENTITYSFYFSKLPVVYIDTNDGYGITSKTEYKGASMHIQGNKTYNSTKTTLYDGGISIRGRGNSTWNTSYSKLPYKLKLDKKTDLLGFGESKHWALLANYMDESLMRNTISYDLSGTMGMRYLKSTHVEVVLNGVYAGNYQLVGNVRIEPSRADVFDWEDCAEDVAKAIKKAHGLTSDQQDWLEEYLTQNMEWITAESISFTAGTPLAGNTYPRSDYESVIPKDAYGNADLSGGFLFELDEYFDEVSRFRTDYNQPIMFKRPEFANTNAQLMQSAQNYIQAVEDSVHSGDFYTIYNSESRHYTDLVDMDSLVNYFVLNEFFWNTETMKKSTYMYKDLGEKLYIGPVWDMDWTSNSLVSAGETGNYSVWMTNARSSNAQAEQWYKYLIGDPYFVVKAYECYKANRANFEDIVKSGGIIDTNKEYLAESAAANYDAHYLRDWRNRDAEFNNAAERLRTFLSNRLSWMDQQFTSVDQLLNSLGKYKASGSISVTADTSGEKTTTYTATVTDSNIKKVGFYVNGILAGTADVSGQTAVLAASDSYLTGSSEAMNVVQVRGLNANGELYNSGNICNYQVFSKEVQVENLTGTVTITGEAKTGKVLTANVTDSNNTGVLSYQWLADGTAIEGAVSSELALTKELAGKRISVRVSSSVEAGSITSAATDAVVEVEVKNDHLIINQIYGGGANDGTPVSHSFIELYNPTENEMDLTGYSLGYLSNGANGTSAEEVKLTLEGRIPAHHSYLIRCEAQDDSTPELIKCTIAEYDQEWEQTIDNKRYRITLYNGTATADAVSVNEGNVEGLALADGTISKQKSIRRDQFADTNNNQSDFKVIDYRTSSSDNYPRSLKDGAWGTEEPGPEEPEELSGNVSIRGNAIVGAVLYADETTNNTGTLMCQWLADGVVIEGETGLFLILDKKYEGKKISVKVSSTVETGSIESTKTEQVKTVPVQTEHLIINQVYGCADKDGAVSHSFIELYNPTAKAVDLSGYSISYTSKDIVESQNLTGEIPAHTSYLIRCAQGKSGSVIYTIEKYDEEWNLAISNKQYKVVLLNGTQQVDGVSVNEGEIEGTALTDPAGDTIISKNKSVRRIGFIDTDQNASDFEIMNYSKITAEILEKAVPRSTANGSWGLDPIDPIDPVDPEDLAELTNTYNEYVIVNNTDNKYTAESWENFQEALKAAKAVLDDKTADKEAIGRALQALNAAHNALTETKVTVDRTELTNKCNLYSAVTNSDSRYTAESWKNFQNALSAAKTVLSDAGAAQAAVNDALKTLEAAYAALQKASGTGTPEKPEPDNKTAIVKGKTYTVNGEDYLVLTTSAAGGTVQYMGYTGNKQKSVKIPDTVKLGDAVYKVTAIAGKALYKKSKVAKVIIGNNVTSIGDSAFEQCTGLKSVTLGRQVKTIGKHAFCGDKKLRTMIVKGTKLTKVAKHSLAQVKSLKIKVPKAKVKKYAKLFKGKGTSTFKVVK